MIKKLTSVLMIALITIATFVFITPDSAEAQGKSYKNKHGKVKHKGKNTYHRKSYWLDSFGVRHYYRPYYGDKKSDKFINDHDASGGRWDGKGPDPYSKNRGNSRKRD